MYRMHEGPLTALTYRHDSGWKYELSILSLWLLRSSFSHRRAVLKCRDAFLLLRYPIRYPIIARENIAFYLIGLLVRYFIRFDTII